MSNVKTPAQQNALAAAAGNPALLELLESLINTVGLTQQATNTKGKNVPAQATAAVSLLKGNYIVEITNPGASSPLSNIQRAQQTQGATQATTIQPVTPILHQIRCATSPSFAINANVQTFGGDTGSTQTHWTLTNLGTGNFYFQFRSSYDGVSWNQWKSANGGQSVTAAPSVVTTEGQTNSDWAVFTLPGQQLIAVGEGYVSDGGTFTLPENLFSSAMAALAGPNGFIDAGRHVSDIANCDVGVVTPADTSGTVGIPDYPILVSMKYGDQSSPQVTWGGNANIFAIAFDPAGKNVTRYISPDGTAMWAVFLLPGGARLAIGNGRSADGADIWIPTDIAAWIQPADVLSVCSPHGSQGAHSAHGVQICQLTASGSNLVANCQYGDGTNTWPGNANWLTVASNLPVQTISGGKWIEVTLGAGTSIAFGAGQAPEESYISSPWAGATLLSIVTPAGFQSSGDNVMHGVAQCELAAGNTPVLTYVDGSGNSWGGTMNWMAFAWINKQVGPPTPPPPAPTAVYVQPSSALTTPLGTVQFTATVVNNANPAVTWAVDGVPGGNSTVGFISGSGSYQAPATHNAGRTITATSVADPTAVGTAGVYVA